MKTRRQGLANEYGLREDYDVGTYPVSDSSMTVNGAGVGAIAAVALATALGAGAVGFGLNAIMNRPATPETNTEIQTDVYDYSVDSEVVPPPQ